MSEVRLQVKHVSKNFGITKALKDVSFNINKGEVHALIGENGSGKSTMTNMLTGIYTLESGQFILDGKEVHPKNQVEANEEGISIIVQELGTLSGLTVAENIFLGHEDQFVHLGIKNTAAMNKKANELGLVNTHFESPHGLDSDGHYTTAYELALLSDYALKNKTFLQIVGTYNYTISINGHPKSLTNTNELLGNLNGVYGIKTGFTNGANRCLVTACKRNDMDIICVVLGCDTKKFRTSDSIKLIEYTFSNFEYVNIQEKIDTELENWKKENENYFFINKGISSDLIIKYSELDTPIIPINKNEISSIDVNIYIDSILESPIHINDAIGKIKVTSNNNSILSCNILASNTIKKKNFLDYNMDFFKYYSNILNSFSIL